MPFAFQPNRYMILLADSSQLILKECGLGLIECSLDD